MSTQSKSKIKVMQQMAVAPLHIKGEYALFTDPASKVERVSYLFPTPTALRGLLDAIYWHPGVKYRVRKCHILEPGRLVPLLRNEIKAPKNTALCVQSERTQRQSLILTPVEYVIEFDVLVTDEYPKQTLVEQGVSKPHQIFCKRVNRGSHAKQPCLGTREFPAQYRWATPEDFERVRKDLYILESTLLTHLEYEETAPFQKQRAKPFFDMVSCREGVVEYPLYY